MAESDELEHQPPDGGPVRVVAVGASAGGLEAFTQLLKALPADTGMAFVLLSHISPTRSSELSRILRPLTAMPLGDAVDGTAVAPNQVYVLPANRIMTIAEGRLHLAERDGDPGHPSAIDEFLQSLAIDQASRAIGVILSGTGTDGTAGLRAIQARGGMTFVEDPALAAYEGMPRSAVRGRVADHVLPIEGIAAALANFDRPAGASDGDGEPELELDAATPDDEGSSAMPATSEEAEALAAIIQTLQTATGVDFQHYKRPSLSRRIRRRMDDVGLSSFAAYLSRLRRDPDEVTGLFDTVLIQVTGFFREPATFGVLHAMVIPSLLTGGSGGTPLRAWVVGCATGQEAYSLAMSFLEVESQLGVDGLIRVFASDLSPAGLAKARLGRYTREECAAVSQERLQEFFVPVDHGFQVTKQLREMCVFARHDITQDPPFAQLDLVLCSNILIYLDDVLQNRVLRNIHYALKPTGYLALGPADTTAGIEGLFSPLDRKSKIYLRRHASSRPHAAFRDTSGRKLMAGKQLLPTPPIPPLQWSTAELQRAAEQVFYAGYPTASVIVNPELEVLHFEGRTSPYLEAPSGGPTVKLLRLARGDLRLPLGRLLRRAKEERVPVRRRGVRVQAGTPRRVNLSVFPVPLGDAEQQHFLVVFDEAARSGGDEASAFEGSAPEGSTDESRVQELETELAESKEYLQAIIDQQDATHAELQAAYEASLSVNEEYQSTNEELESAKEEMQSLNEELTTVNEQLHQRHAELEARTAELNTLLESVDMPMVLLSPDLRLRAFNSRAAGDLRLAPELVGRSFAEARLPLPVRDLRELIELAIREGQVQERELEADAGRWQALRIWPVPSPGDGGTVAVALVDITRLKTDVAHATAAQAHSQAIVETVMMPLAVLDDDFRVVHANPAFHRLFGTDAEAVGGRPIAEVGDLAWGNELPALLLRTQQSGRPIAGPEIVVESRSLGRRIFRLGAGVIGDGAVGGGRILLAIDDITARKLSEASEMEASRMQAVGALAGGVAHEINNQMTVVLGFADALLRQGGPAGPHADDLSRIVKAARRSADITGQLLAFSRRQRLEPVVFDLNGLVAASESLIRRALGPDITLEIALGEGVGQVRADQAQFEQVLVNLSLNARDAMRGAGRLTIETTTVLVTERSVPAVPGGQVVPRGLYARLIVRDTGEGIDRATQERIFEPFFTTKPVGQGTGLGLSSVYGTVKQSGGSIWVESSPGKGSTFTIDLPQVHGAAPAKPPEAPRSDEGGSETILVVDDEEAVRAWVARSLQELGYTVVEAGGAVEALRLVEQAQPPIDLVLADIVMPGFDGARLRARLAEAHPDLPVLLTSGFALEELVRQGRLERETVLLYKPFDPGELASRVRQALDAAASQDRAT